MIRLLPLVLVPLLLQDGERRAVDVEATPRASVASSDAELRLYDVGHLTGAGRLAALEDEATHAETPLPGQTALELLENLRHLRERVQSTEESISRAIQDLLEPRFDGRVNGLAHLEGGRLGLVATPEQHAWLARFLDHAARFDGLIDIQTRIYTLAKGQLAGLSQERSGEVLSEAQTSELLGRLEQLPTELVQAPRVLVHPFQQAELTAVEQLAYVRDYELKILPGQDVEIADPVIDVAESGVVLELRCVPLVDGRLSIDADIVTSSVAEPIPTLETTLGALSHPVTIQLPEITRVRLEGRFEVSSGDTFLMASANPTGTEEVLVLVRASRVEALPQDR